MTDTDPNTLADELEHDVQVLNRMASDPDLMSAWYCGEPLLPGHIASNAGQIAERVEAAARLLRTINPQPDT